MKKTVVYLGNKLAITAIALVLQHSPSLQESSLQNSALFLFHHR